MPQLARNSLHRGKRENKADTNTDRRDLSISFSALARGWQIEKLAKEANTTSAEQAKQSTN